MPYTLLLHLSNSEPIKVDVDEMPNPSDTNLTCRNPRDRADREVDFLDDGVNTVIFPWWRVNYIQVLPNPEDELEFPLPFRE